MALLVTNKDPTDRQLRQFGFALLAFLVAATYWFTGSTWGTMLATTIGVITAGLGVIHPQRLKPLFIAMILATAPISFVVGELILLFVYFGIFFPLATLFRMIGRDSLNRRKPVETASYWQQRPNSTSMETYFRQS